MHPFRPEPELHHWWSGHRQVHNFRSHPLPHRPSQRKHRHRFRRLARSDRSSRSKTRRAKYTTSPAFVETRWKTPTTPFRAPSHSRWNAYGQGETQQISQRAQTDPSALLDYLDRFVDIREEVDREEELRQTLLALQTKIEEAIRQVELIPQSERDLAHTKSQMQALEKANAKEIVSLQRKVELERQIRQVILTSSQAIARGTTQQELKDNIAALKTAADPKTLVVGSAEFSAISTQAGRL